MRRWIVTCLALGGCVTEAQVRTIARFEARMTVQAMVPVAGALGIGNSQKQAGGDVDSPKQTAGGDIGDEWVARIQAIGYVIIVVLGLVCMVGGLYLVKYRSGLLRRGFNWCQGKRERAAT